MAAFRNRRVPAVLAALSLPMLAGCVEGVTYGTGTRTEIQTLKDVSGLVALSKEEKEPIEYRQRAGIVVPPKTGALPPPSEGAAANAANWPVDPDKAARDRRKQELASTEAYDASRDARVDPGFRLGKGASIPTEADQARSDAEGFKRLAAAKAQRAGSVDATGAPTRRYLTEPPAEYRTPDPNAPVDPVPPPEQKKSFLKKLWPW